MFTSDTKFSLPDLTVVTASAGSGKTRTLTLRYLQLLLSERISHNDLRNILAMTFTNNAAAEMKQRVIKYLKALALGKGEVPAEVQELVSMQGQDLRDRAEYVLEMILERFSDFQVRTIDSFLISVFQSTALEFGYAQTADITFNPDKPLAEAFAEFAHDADAQAQYSDLLRKLVSLIEQTRFSYLRFLWNPYGNMLRECQRLYRSLRMVTKPLIMEDKSSELTEIAKTIEQQGRALQKVLDESGLTISHNFQNDLNEAKQKNIEALLERTKKNRPFNKPSVKQHAGFQKYGTTIEEELARFYGLLAQYAEVFSQSRFYPYARTMELIEGHVDEISRRDGALLLDEIHWKLKDNLTRSMVPEIYYKLGESVHHFLIDEFQDTSPIQWFNLKPLLEETLSKDGSLFVVGDTKQSIYGFRGADWTIMKRLAQGSEFGSVQPTNLDLRSNYRSLGNIVEFNRQFFCLTIPMSEYAEAAKLSDLSDVDQRVPKDRQNKGFVRVHLVPHDVEARPERAKVMKSIDDCLNRGYKYHEIAILTPENNDVIMISSWLNEHKPSIPFVSHSNLDVRRRKSVGEVIALLKFLDSPVDDLSFATFLLGKVFLGRAGSLAAESLRDEIKNLLFEVHRSERRFSPLYRVFQDKYKQHWTDLFEPLFTSVGYLPLYDLVSEAYKIFQVLALFNEEEAAHVKFLEAVRAYEQEGNNSLKEFLEYAEEKDDTDRWTMSVPAGTNAVNVMTVHKAKGLDYPVVLVFLRDKEPRLRDPQMDEGDEDVRLLSLTEKIGEKSESLQALHDEKLLVQQADALNKLYVALTRAREEMHIVCVMNEERKGPTKYLVEQTIGKPQERELRLGLEEQQTLTQVQYSGTLRNVAVSDKRRIALKETQRGELIHELMARLEFLDTNIDRDLESVWERVDKSRRNSFEQSEILMAVKAFLVEGEVSSFFKKDRKKTVLTEQEFVNKNGELFRCDRIVIEDGTVTVIDFKTGGQENEKEYLTQVKNYMEILREIYPTKKTQGFVAYIDIKKIVSVE
ncbi:MAG: UvrD-helicase domain-containing protein [Ignavibacteriales bacterium]|nr:UvrD-helicase domain-containing protein [Ignavibacteriales bacterium]